MGNKLTPGFRGVTLCVAKERGLGFVKNEMYFCLFKTYVIGLNLIDFLDFL